MRIVARLVLQISLLFAAPAAAHGECRSKRLLSAQQLMLPGNLDVVVLIVQTETKMVLIWDLAVQWEK